MAHFLTRIELHEAESEDYDKLHTSMEDRGFAKTITGDDGVTYILPTATYYCESTHGTADIREIAREVANGTGRRNSVIVVEGRFSWHLPPE
ncbi:type V toxin-antitoxin system endoribonuclease antitoxin GhoS [Burkholderia pyrrocinia]|uniref:type V toxin-antitoxin system endoribonuclease antitoxin GhoS n=1 Tax=Burkholderia pyrrocinia TaxID=60550 RepID=UPI0038B47AB3